LLVLRKILLCRFLYFILIVLAFFHIFFATTNNQVNQFFSKNTSSITGIIESISVNGSKVIIYVKATEKVLVTYYLKTKEEKQLLQKYFMLGDKIQVTGTIQNPTSTKNFYSFSYQNYLAYQNIYHIFKAETIKKIKSNQQVIYFLRQKIRTHISTLGKSANYVYTFFLGDTSLVDPKVKLSFQKIGISHLFALSGTQVSFLAIMLKKLLKKFKLSDKKEFIFTLIILFIYYLLIDSCAAVDRAIIFFLIFGINKIFNFYISPFSLILLSISIMIFINPYYIFDIGFQYSTIISSGLLLYSSKLKSKYKVMELLKISWVSFLLSLPISLYHFSYINIFSIFYNLFYVPFINIFIFPISMLTVLLPFLKDLLFISTVFLETSVTFLSRLSFGIIIFKRIDIYWYFIYYLFILSFLYTRYSKVMFLFLFSSLMFHFFLPKLFTVDRFYMLDVGQGDCFLFVSNHQVMLVDTGGKMKYDQEDWQQGVDSLGGGHYIMQFIYHLGFSNISKIILTHGDADHALESLTLLENIGIDEIYFNHNGINTLEYQIIEAATLKGVSVKQVDNDEIFTFGNFTFQVLSRDLTDENDSSVILLGSIKDKKILLMGDASIKSEQQLLKYYDLPTVDILKVGHHGSKTSSSDRFLNVIRPKYALISAGVHNKFNHPHQVIMKRLKKYHTKIYQSAIEGMVCFDFKQFKISTYS